MAALIPLGELAVQGVSVQVEGEGLVFNFELAVAVGGAVVPIQNDRVAILRRVDLRLQERPVRLADDALAAALQDHPAVVRRKIRRRVLIRVALVEVLRERLVALLRVRAKQRAAGQRRVQLDLIAVAQIDVVAVSLRSVALHDGRAVGLEGAVISHQYTAALQRRGVAGEVTAIQLQRRIVDVDRAAAVARFVASKRTSCHGGRAVLDANRAARVEGFVALKRTLALNGQLATGVDAAAVQL